LTACPVHSHKPFTRCELLPRSFCYLTSASKVHALAASAVKKGVIRSRPFCEDAINLQGQGLINLQGHRTGTSFLRTPSTFLAEVFWHEDEIDQNWPQFITDHFIDKVPLFLCHEGTSSLCVGRSCIDVQTFRERRKQHHDAPPK